MTPIKGRFKATCSPIQEAAHESSSPSRPPDIPSSPIDGVTSSSTPPIAAAYDATSSRSTIAEDDSIPEIQLTTPEGQHLDVELQGFAITDEGTAEETTTSTDNSFDSLKLASEEDISFIEPPARFNTNQGNNSAQVSSAVKNKNDKSTYSNRGIYAIGNTSYTSEPANENISNASSSAGGYISSSDSNRAATADSASQASDISSASDNLDISDVPINITPEYTGIPMIRHGFRAGMSLRGHYSLIFVQVLFAGLMPFPFSFVFLIIALFLSWWLFDRLPIDGQEVGVADLQINIKVVKSAVQEAAKQTMRELLGMPNIAFNQTTGQDETPKTFCDILVGFGQVVLREFEDKFGSKLDAEVEANKELRNQVKALEKTFNKREKMMEKKLDEMMVVLESMKKTEERRPKERQNSGNVERSMTSFASTNEEREKAYIQDGVVQEES